MNFDDLPKLNATMPGATTVDIPQSIKDTLRKFRFARRSSGSAALIIKINKSQLILEEVEQFDSISIEELAEGALHLTLVDINAHESPIELPENAPRYVMLSYELNHKDGRKSFPLVLINWAPSTSSPELLTLHASALLNFQTTADVMKVIEVRDGPEGLTKELVDQTLGGRP
ncbi:hypothetical protein H0H92_005395 [Tricholoma furcatifolium]|nr:hypothetical protein H0H92_005395 [Tricholoma furcatifolium]